MGRKPKGDRAMTDAERQQAYRNRIAAQRPPKPPTITDLEKLQAQIRQANRTIIDLQRSMITYRNATTHHGIFDKSEFNRIIKALHPDRAKNTDLNEITEATKLLNAHKKALIKKGHQ